MASPLPGFKIDLLLGTLDDRDQKLTEIKNIVGDYSDFDAFLIAANDIWGGDISVEDASSIWDAAQTEPDTTTTIDLGDTDFQGIYEEPEPTEPEDIEEPSEPVTTEQITPEQIDFILDFIAAQEGTTISPEVQSAIDAVLTTLDSANTPGTTAYMADGSVFMGEGIPDYIRDGDQNIVADFTGLKEQLNMAANTSFPSFAEWLAESGATFTDLLTSSAYQNILSLTATDETGAYTHSAMRVLQDVQQAYDEGLTEEDWQAIAQLKAEEYGFATVEEYETFIQTLRSGLDEGIGPNELLATDENGNYTHPVMQGINALRTKLEQGYTAEDISEAELAMAQQYGFSTYAEYEAFISSFREGLDAGIPENELLAQDENGNFTHPVMAKINQLAGELEAGPTEDELQEAALRGAQLYGFETQEEYDTFIDALRTAVKQGIGENELLATDELGNFTHPLMAGMTALRQQMEAGFTEGDMAEADIFAAQEYGFDSVGDYKDTLTELFNSVNQGIGAQQGFSTEELATRQAYQASERERQEALAAQMLDAVAANGNSTSRYLMQADEFMRQIRNSDLQYQVQLADEGYNRKVAEWQGKQAQLESMVSSGQMSRKNYLDAITQNRAQALEAYATQIATVTQEREFALSEWSRKADILDRMVQTNQIAQQDYLELLRQSKADAFLAYQGMADTFMQERQNVISEFNTQAQRFESMVANGQATKQEYLNGMTEAYTAALDAYYAEAGLMQQDREMLLQENRDRAQFLNDMVANGQITEEQYADRFYRELDGRLNAANVEIANLMGAWETEFDMLVEQNAQTLTEYANDLEATKYSVQNMYDSIATEVGIYDHYMNTFADLFEMEGLEKYSQLEDRLLEAQIKAINAKSSIEEISAWAGVISAVGNVVDAFIPG